MAESLRHDLRPCDQPCMAPRRRPQDPHTRTLTRSAAPAVHPAPAGAGPRELSPA
jgi:hypothetical protein